jgi:hypothetical protein
MLNALWLYAAPPASSCRRYMARTPRLSSLSHRTLAAHARRPRSWFHPRRRPFAPWRLLLRVPPAAAALPTSEMLNSVALIRLLVERNAPPRRSALRFVCLRFDGLRFRVPFKVLIVNGLRDLRFTIYDLRVTSYDLRFTIYDLRFTIYDLRVTSYELRVTIYDLRVTIYDLRFTIYDLRFEVEHIYEMLSTGLQFTFKFSRIVGTALRRGRPRGRRLYAQSRPPPLPCLCAHLTTWPITPSTSGTCKCFPAATT